MMSGLAFSGIVLGFVTALPQVAPPAGPANVPQKRAQAKVDAARKTVTTIACEFGFFELGRFSRAYKAAFGESPSQTIKTHNAVVRGAW